MGNLGRKIFASWERFVLPGIGHNLEIYDGNFRLSKREMFFNKGAIFVKEADKTIGRCPKTIRSKMFFKRGISAGDCRKQFFGWKGKIAW